MAYGPDPDPYGAVRPYSIGYETYTPNYPGIPGVANSFAAGGAGVSQALAIQREDSHAPTVGPGAPQTGNMGDYNYYYERNSMGNMGNNEQMAIGYTPTETPVPSSAGTSQHTGLPMNPYASSWYNNPLAGQAFQSGPMTPISPWNSNGSSINPASAGLGRKAEIPQPIGTRPGHNGHAQQLPTPSSGSSNPAMEAQMRAYRAAAAAAGCGRDGNTESPTRRQQGGVPLGNAPMSKSTNVNIWMQQLQLQEQQKRSHADEMSRER